MNMKKKSLKHVSIKQGVPYVLDNTISMTHSNGNTNFKDKKTPFWKKVGVNKWYEFVDKINTVPK